MEGAIVAKYRNAGQTCVCVNRLFVHDQVYERFVTAFAARVRELRVGNGFAPDTQIGPLISEKAVGKVSELIGDALAKGARLVEGGQPHSAGPLFFQPTILADVAPGMQLLDEEIFGPVTPVVRFSSDAEVVRLANDTPYGLAAYFYSRDVGRVWRIAEQLEYGMVGVNTGLISNEVAPFGGVKESGLGREGSKYGIEDYLEMKYLCLAV
ncbi:Glutarate-semialdehyde dehydrogenase DavD [compost metagenome]